jgi:hypothetical protein
MSNSNERAHAAGAFDVRNVIGGLIGLYGLVLLVVGIVDHSPSALKKTGGVNADLWAGIVMVVVAAGFLAWSRWRPIVVRTKKGEPGDG